MSLVYEEKTEVLRGCFFDVQNRVGLGRDEEDYHQAVKLCLKENDVPFVSKQPHSLILYDQVAHKLFPDIVVWDAITVELKSIPRNPSRTEFVQLFDYLKCRGDSLGLFVNMGLDRVHVDRFVYDAPETNLEEDWNYWSGRIDGAAREVGIRVREALRDVYNEHTTGYGDEVLRKLILFALAHQQLSVVESPVAMSYYGDIALRESALECLVVEGAIVLTYTALFDNNDFNMNRGLSYLDALNLKWGIAANFGKSQAQFTALRRA